MTRKCSVILFMINIYLVLAFSQLYSEKRRANFPTPPKSYSLYRTRDETGRGTNRDQLPVIFRNPNLNDCFFCPPNTVPLFVIRPVYSHKSKVCPRLLPPRLLEDLYSVFPYSSRSCSNKRKVNFKNSRGGKSWGQTFDLGE